MTTSKLTMLLALSLWPLGSGMAAEVNEAPVEIVVTGRQPGPPLWKVSNGDKVLWIFPYLRWIPDGMIWESGRVERVIAESQEVLSLPKSYWGASPMVRLNPINIPRNARLMSRLARNPDGGTLKENLPPALFARFASLHARYFPAYDEPLEMRPLFAGQTMTNIIRKQKGLVPGDDILKTIRRLERRSRGSKRTEISVSTEIDGFGEYADRMEAVVESLSPEQELVCFEQLLRHAEEDLDEMKNRANAWARGFINEFRNFPLGLDESNTCNDLLWGSSSPEQEGMMGMTTRLNQMWLGAAENALATNTSTFAILPINELVAEDGLLSRLKAKGYDVREP